MKHITILSALLPVAALCAAEPAPNVVKNGGFEMPGTVVTGWARKQHWVGWGMVHGKSAKSNQILALAKRTVTDKNPAAGKYAAAIISPKEMLAVESPAPVFSNKISQICAIPVSDQPTKWQLNFQMRGNFIASKPAAAFYLFADPYKADSAKPGKFLANGKGLQKGFPVKAEWQKNSVEITVPAGTSQLQLVFALYQAGEVYLDEISFVKK